MRITCLLLVALLVLGAVSTVDAVCKIGDSCIVHGDCRGCSCRDGRAAECDREHNEPWHCSCHRH